MVGRLAPSPTGIMHWGNASTALLAWLQVRSQAGTLLLRIEDLDPQRSKPEFAEGWRRDLSWLGLEWDREVPQQSLRGASYHCLLYTSPSPRDVEESRMPSSA